MAAPINSAFDFIVPKYQFHTNQAYIVIDNQWQAQDYIKRENELRQPMCQLKHPASGNSCDGSDIINDPSLLNEYNNNERHYYYSDRSPSFISDEYQIGLPPVKLPFTPPTNLGLTKNGTVKYPHFPKEHIIRGAFCSQTNYCKQRH